jgi:hypothetical protein
VQTHPPIRPSTPSSTQPPHLPREPEKQPWPVWSPNVCRDVPRPGGELSLFLPRRRRAQTQHQHHTSSHTSRKRRRSFAKRGPLWLCEKHEIDRVRRALGKGMCPWPYLNNWLLPVASADERSRHLYLQYQLRRALVRKHRSARTAEPL